MIEFSTLNRRVRYLLAGIAIAAIAVVSGALPASAAVAHPGAVAAPQTVSSKCANGVCISVPHSGLAVGTATVTNNGVKADHAKIINVDAGATHVGPVIGPGGSWPFAFGRSVNPGDSICGQVGNSARTCVTIN